MSQNAFEILLVVAQAVATVAVLFLVASFANKRLEKHFETKPHLNFRRQLLQLGGFLFVILLLILFLPLDTALRGQLLSLYGIIISATIALSSTTLVGNIMAGIMLKTIKTARPGYYITVGDHFGRITTMDLLHTEIQTEDRDLTTLPNLYLITHPVRVMRTSGTLIYVELSLGYDVPRHQVEKLLLDAAAKTELESPFVQIRQLGDFSVTYRVSGLLTDIKRLIDKRRELRARTMDALHEAEVEIVSPTFMNTRAFDPNEMFVPEVEKGETPINSDVSTDKLVFDKAEEAESVSKLRERLGEAQERLKICKEALKDKTDEKKSAAAAAEMEGLERKIERLTAMIDRKEAKISEE
jgi:small conductance mechanosensitive channel